MSFFFETMFDRLIFPLILLVLVSISSPVVSKIPEKNIVVIIPSYNNELWYEKNLESLFEQDYTNYKVIYIDDCSKDCTADLVEKYVKEKKQEDRFELIKNQTNQGALKNLYHAILSCEDDDIIITYDGDDWFPNDKVLQTINQAYQSKNVWLTFGTFITHPDGIINHLSKPYPKKVIKKNLFRKYKHPSHLRTFYAWLFKKIRKNDLMYDGEFYAMAWDLAMMFPMLEMAGERHKCIEALTYVYNQANPINDNKTDAQLQDFLASHIRGLKRYSRLKNKTDTSRHQ